MYYFIIHVLCVCVSCVKPWHPSHACQQYLYIFAGKIPHVVAMCVVCTRARAIITHAMIVCVWTSASRASPGARNLPALPRFREKNTTNRGVGRQIPARGAKGGAQIQPKFRPGRCVVCAHPRCTILLSLHVGAVMVHAGSTPLQ